jgi:hypothetical protein
VLKKIEQSPVSVYPLKLHYGLTPESDPTKAEIKSKMKHHWRNLINKNNYLLNIDMFNSHNIEDFNYIKLKYVK